MKNFEPDWRSGMDARNGDLTGLRILIMEDESLVAMLIQDILADIGCEIAGVASRFDDAMKKAKTVAFDIAIVDVNLHGTQTFAIAEELAKRGLAFIFATGYGAENLPEPLRTAPILKKPFQQSDLEQALRAALT
jgi:CheY-like chemotaxis protein